ncbi:hypothetical protein DFA_04135 [Cavenderia fasciculata]|uniref:Uncharacterized protein n=1 Tax=Cavenderia fasciculata TaxID=261658 RepID=F4Q1D9_CACFS|nr:uncharacterized protein DFA_04135 [Cavenderia fasciculata]EGG18640.1 hypothetical protein DFA_04135 [Cavenderia fasciculata]|eukprot:XP_004366544.1 hypothetical protein DFA_04135 [Cavenderia fasciculata]
MKIARPSFSFLKKQPKILNDQAPLNELKESRFQVQQLLGTDEFIKGKWSQPRILAVCEDGIKIITSNESQVLDEFLWVSIKQFNLKENWTEWEIELKDRRKIYFKSDKAFDLHMATDHILDGLIRNTRSNGYEKAF